MAADSTGAVARGVAWMLLARAADRIGGILSIAITARYLSPNDFGMFHMALSVMALVEVFALFGFDWALIRHPDPKREHFDTAFTLQLIVAVATSALIVALAHPFAAFYRTPQIAPAIMAMALAPLLSATSNLAIVHLRRDMRFEADFWRMFIPRIVTFVVGILLAVWWQSYWALIVSMLIGKLASAAIGYVLHPYRPRLSLQTWRELIGYSMWLQLAGIIDGLRTRLGDLVVGRMLGTHSLAIYNMSTDLANMPLQEFVGAVNTAVFSKYARLQDEAAELKAAYTDTIALTFMVGLPAAVGLWLTAPAFVRLLLGPQWSDAAPVVQILAAGAFASALAANSTYILNSTGKPRIATALVVLNLVFMALLLLAFVGPYGLMGAAIAFSGTGVLIVPAHLLVMRRVIGFRLRELWPRIWRTLLAALAMAVVLRMALPAVVPETTFAAGVTFFAAAAAGAIIYVGAVTLLWIASGRPTAIESMLLFVARDILGRVSARFR